MIDLYRKLMFAVFVAALIAACGGDPVVNKDRVGSRTAVDSLGRSVRIPERIERAVSLAPSITELIFAAGAGDRLVGVTTYCNYPAEALNIPKIGDTQSPNIEAIIALRPQVVFVSTDSQMQPFAAALTQQNVAVFVVTIKTFDDLSARLRELGVIFGTEEHAFATADYLQKRIQNVEARVKAFAPVRTFVQISREPLFTVGRDSFVTAAVEHAGGVSVTKDVPTAYPKLNKETAFALKPDVIILSDSEDNQAPNDALKDSPAVMNARVYKINADIISRPGPRIVDAIEQMASFLHDGR